MVASQLAFLMEWIIKRSELEIITNLIREGGNRGRPELGRSKALFHFRGNAVATIHV